MKPLKTLDDRYTMREMIDFLVSEAKDDRDDLKREIREAVGGGRPCTICGALIEGEDGIGLHSRWHLRVREDQATMARNMRGLMDEVDRLRRRPKSPRR